jgi:sugar O-acyltransferase (sialic acid O-acetyltransferase NeuD family)
VSDHPNDARRIAILGAGGLAREVLDVFVACNAVRPTYEVMGFVDDNPELRGRSVNGLPVLGSIESLRSLWSNDAPELISGVGLPSVRRAMVGRCHGFRFCTVVHPAATTTPAIQVGSGSVVTAGCVLTNQIVIGHHCYVNLGVTIGHDCFVGDFCNLSPGVHVSGNVHLGTGCDIGSGAVLIQGVTIGEWSVIGAGAVVIRNVPPNVTVAGVPARVIKTRPEGWHLGGTPEGALSDREGPGAGTGLH